MANKTKGAELKVAEEVSVKGKRREDAIKQMALLDNGSYLLDGKYVKGEYVVKQLGITEKTLITLSEGGEFAMGRIAGIMVVDTVSLFTYLDRVHFKKASSEEEELAVDAKGRVKVDLTFVGTPHTDIPTLRPVNEYAKILGLDDRTFIRHCDTGTFRHYRIGSLYKMSEEDFSESLAFVTSTGMKSHRGTKGGSLGRPNKVVEIMKQAAEKKSASK